MYFVERNNSTCFMILPGTDNCDDNAECVNKPGRFKCRCKQGYSKQGPRGQKTCQGMSLITLTTTFIANMLIV